MDTLNPRDVNLEVVDLETGEVLIAEHNTITLGHRRKYAEFITGRDVTTPNHMAVGNGVLVAGDQPERFTAMKSETGRVSFEGGSLSDGYTARLVGIIPANAAMGEINEIGLFDAAAQGSLQLANCDTLNGWSPQEYSGAPSSASLSTTSLQTDVREGTHSLRVASTSTSNYYTRFRITGPTITNSLAAVDPDRYLELSNDLVDYANADDAELQFWFRKDDGTTTNFKARLEWDSWLLRMGHRAASR